jgi:hypothetical protein
MYPRNNPDNDSYFIDIPYNTLCYRATKAPLSLPYLQTERQVFRTHIEMFDRDSL